MWRPGRVGTLAGIAAALVLWASVAVPVSGTGPTYALGVHWLDASYSAIGAEVFGQSECSWDASTLPVDQVTECNVTGIVAPTGARHAMVDMFCVGGDPCPSIQVVQQAGHDMSSYWWDVAGPTDLQVLRSMGMTGFVTSPGATGSASGGGWDECGYPRVSDGAHDGCAITDGEVVGLAVSWIAFEADPGATATPTPAPTAAPTSAPGVVVTAFEGGALDELHFIGFAVVSVGTFAVLTLAWIAVGLMRR